MFSRSKLFTLVLLLLVAVGISGEAFARAGGGSSSGSRGSRTFNAPPATNVAPNAAPLNRSAMPNQGSAMAQPARGGFFSGGFGRGLLGGLVGAGLFGLLMGHGFSGGLGGGESFLGLLLQVGLLLLGAKLLFSFFRNRQAQSQPQPAFGGAAFSPLPGGSAFAQGGGGNAEPVRAVPLSLTSTDFEAFERRLNEVQTTYGTGDASGLRRLATAEMANSLADELAAHERRGEINRLSDIKLVAGDLSEAWREGDVEFATVAMRYTLVDQTFDKASGRLLGGNPAPQTVTEVWTFTRPSGTAAQAWILSAIQQA